MSRLAQLVGTITDEPGPGAAREGPEPVRATSEHWAEAITGPVSEQPFSGVVFWPEETSTEQVQRFAREVEVAGRVRSRPRQTAPTR